MTSRHFAIAAVWAVSLVGVGPLAQESGRRAFTFDDARQQAVQTGGTVEGRVEDRTGGLIPGATVVLISETSGERRVPGVTGQSGTYLFRSVPPDTYTIEVTMPGFRTLRRSGVVVGGDSRVVVPTVALQTGAALGGVQVPPMLGPGYTAAGPVISGDDIGFRLEYSPNTPAGAVTGRWMVRVNGEWLEAATAVRTVPAR